LGNAQKICEKNLKAKGAWGMAQVVNCFASKSKALSSNPSTARRRKRRRRRRKRWRRRRPNPVLTFARWKGLLEPSHSQDKAL
jgi:hypothetical protein